MSADGSETPNDSVAVTYAKRTGEITVVKLSLGRELEVMRAIGEALERLDQPARDRVLRWARDKYLS